MSIEALVNQFGMTLYQFTPTIATGADGQVSRTYEVTGAARKGFVQPSSQSDGIFQGRVNGRRSATIYFAELFRVDVDDEFHDSDTGSVRNWRVTGSVNPAELGETGLAFRLNMMTVSVVEVEPEVTVGLS